MAYNNCFEVQLSWLVYNNVWWCTWVKCQQCWDVKINRCVFNLARGLSTHQLGLLSKKEWSSLLSHLVTAWFFTSWTHPWQIVARFRIVEGWCFIVKNAPMTISVLHHHQNYPQFTIREQLAITINPSVVGISFISVSDWVASCPAISQEVVTPNMLPWFSMTKEPWLSSPGCPTAVNHGVVARNRGGSASPVVAPGCGRAQEALPDQEPSHGRGRRGATQGGEAVLLAAVAMAATRWFNGNNDV